jgi:RHS repeat-associated protein
VTYEYDPLNRMSIVTAPSGATEYFYNKVGNRDSVANANGTMVSYEYDDLNRLTQLTNYGPDGSVISRYTYQLNAAGVRTAVTEADGSRVDYTYDDTYKLTGEIRSGTHPYAISYVYDPAGNRLEQTRDGATTTYTYNNRDQLMTETSPVGMVFHAYDHAGRQTTKTDSSGTTSYGWEDNDRMVSVTGPTVAVTYGYDQNGQRVSAASGAGTTNYLVDYGLPYGQVIAETDENAQLDALYVYGLERISMHRNGKTCTYALDGQGSVRHLTGEVANVTDAYCYTAFGPQLAEAGSTENPFRYVGEQWDGNARLYYNRARWYSPTEGRFVSVDPHAGDLTVPISLHRYLYANASPASYVDPSGDSTMVPAVQFQILSQGASDSVRLRFQGR